MAYRSVQSHSGEENGRLDPTSISNKILEFRVRRATECLEQAGQYSHLTALSRAVNAKQLTAAVYRAHAVPLREYLDRMSHESDNLLHQDNLIARIVQSVPFQEHYFSLPKPVELLWRLSAIQSDIGKEGFFDHERTNDSLYRRGHNPLRTHPEIGALVLEQAGFKPERPILDRPPKRHPPLFDPTLPVSAARRHQEMYDGSERGYPDRLNGRQIRLPVRLIKLVDSAVAMGFRPQSRHKTPDAILAEIEHCKGKDFDPEMVEVSKRIIDHYLREHMAA